MSRNGPVGQPRAPARRSAADEDPYAGGQSGWPSPPGADPHQQGYAPQAGQAPQHSQGYYFPQPVEPDPNQGYPLQPVNQALPFDRLPQASAPPATQWDAQQLRDAGHYDLGSYLPTGGEPRGYGPAEAPPFAGSADGPFRHQYAPRDGYSESDGEYEAMGDEEGDEPRRGRRGLVIAGALVGAIGLGGAMAYTYKTFIATPTRAPVVKVTDAGPSKVKPSLSGGKEFAHTDKKLLNRLDEEGASQRGGAADDRANEDPNAPRRVRSIPISPAGQVAGAGGPPGAAALVPGITLDNIGGAPPPPSRVQIPTAPPPQATVARAEASVGAPPVRVVAAPPPAPAAVAVDAGPPPARKVAAIAPAPTREAAPPKVSSAVVTASTTGYVAVLSSQKSRMDALKAFADLQQKYGDVLSSKTPDVQEANLGDKGVWYRAVVGPPVSRDAASGICSQLKAAGYAGCWVTAY
ncbi:MAG TPA: SPOR domain-containing protein [Hyphomicrobiaceae bacterium]|jgi:SPOR domain|nr:SPOR domain-containing protein [Hyphomicrobiaceae bacterium]